MTADVVRWDDNYADTHAQRKMKEEAFTLFEVLKENMRETGRDKMECACSK